MRHQLYQQKDEQKKQLPSYSFLYLNEPQSVSVVVAFLENLTKLKRQTACLPDNNLARASRGPVTNKKQSDCPAYLTASFLKYKTTISHLHQFFLIDISQTDL